VFVIATSNQRPDGLSPRGALLLTLSYHAQIASMLAMN
jgi:hypothetical protein